MYHGRGLNPDQLKSVIILNTKESRERFGDRTLDAAILIELKKRWLPGRLPDESCGGFVKRGPEAQAVTKHEAEMR